ncbi:MAG: nitroreductase family protein [Leptospiraceae bacterium]|nr:nitroreductase family protein [Leptospiraceae bacterium]
MNFSANFDRFQEVVRHRRSCRIYEQQALPAGLVQQALELAMLSPNSSNMQLWEFHHISTPAVIRSLGPACLDQKAVSTASELVVFVARRDLFRERADRLVANQLKVMGKEKRSDLSTPERKLIDYWDRLMPLLYRHCCGFWTLVRKLAVWWTAWRKPQYREVSETDMRVVAHKSVSLAAQTFMLAIAAAGYDSCPLEGFDSSRVKKILGLGKRSEITMIVSCGKRSAAGIYGERFRLPPADVYFQH